MPKRLLMCPTDYFDIEYEINPWMKTQNQVDTALAKLQWQQIYDIYYRLGHQVELVDPVKGLPDMIFTANGGLVIDGKVMLPRFRHPQRQPETAHFKAWFEANGYTKVAMPQHDFEGEGDCLLAGRTLFAGHGFRSDQASHAELADFFSLKVVSLKLVDPYFYHLDTCFHPLSADVVMFLPAAFDAPSQAAIRNHFKTVIEADARDGAAYGLNAYSDGRNVVLSNRATGLIEQLKHNGFNPIAAPITEFQKSGGGVKCITLELRPPLET
jgi:N-dimethylarginine dimethylaminohydrolase